MVRAVYLATGDMAAAEDGTQVAFERAYRRWPRLERETWATGWVMTTALNSTRRSLRLPLRRSRVPEIRPDHGPEVAERTRVVEALKALPHRQRMVAILFYLGDLPISEISSHMGVAEGTVKAQLSAARKRLGTLLEAHLG